MGRSLRKANHGYSTSLSERTNRTAIRVRRSSVWSAYVSFVRDGRSDYGCVVIAVSEGRSAASPVGIVTTADESAERGTNDRRYRSRPSAHESRWYFSQRLVGGNRTGLWLSIPSPAMSKRTALSVYCSSATATASVSLRRASRRGGPRSSSVEHSPSPDCPARSGGTV